MSFPRYPSYKDSKSDWVAQVPEHWQLMPCRGFVDERTEKNEDALCQNYLSLMANVGVIPYEEKGDIGNKKPEDLSKCKLVNQGDFVINSMNYGIGSYGASAYDGVCSPVYIVMKPRQDIVESGFAFRVFEDKSFQARAQSLGNGILAHRCAISWDDLKGISVGIPPVAEQRAILEFLDRETAKIDALIAEQQRLIELLQEKRQAVISHAVTKGLNPNAPMKDSGVEWLGEVPEHWELIRGRFLYKKREEVPRESDEVVTAFRDGQVIQRNLRRVDGFTLAELEVGYQHVCIGDLVIHGMDAFAGAIGVSESEGKCTPEYSVCHPINTSHSNAYFAHALRVMAKRDYIYVICPSVRERAPRFRFNTFKDVALPVPPPEEQASISKAIANECTRLSELVSSAESLVAVLQERRSALISAAVTGQIDVRGLVMEAIEQ